MAVNYRFQTMPEKCRLTTAGFTYTQTQPVPSGLMTSLSDGIPRFPFQTGFQSLHRLGLVFSLLWLTSIKMATTSFDWGRKCSQWMGQNRRQLVRVSLFQPEID
jgi:hypothetical protein